MAIFAHQIQLLPNNQQAHWFRQACGIKRFAWNWALREWERSYALRKPRCVGDFGDWVKVPERTEIVDDFGTAHTLVKPNGQALKKVFSAKIDSEWPWMRAVSSYAYQQVFADLDQAFKRFFKGLAKHPRRKKKGRCRESFYLANTCVEVSRRKITIAKLGTVTMRQALRFHGRIMSARVAEDAGRWMISIAVDMPEVTPVHSHPDKTVGVDVGVHCMAALSTGEMIQNPQALARHGKKLKRLQRQSARQYRAALKTQHGIAEKAIIPSGLRIVESKRAALTKKKVQRVHRDIRNLRANAQHQLTARITQQFGQIAIEDLNVKGMTASAKGTTDKPGKKVKQKAGLNKSILNVGFGEIRRQLDYKAKRTGATVIVINRWTPSSKTCSACGACQEKMPLSIRDWVCPECGAHHDRDVNAAKNILQAGLTQPPVEKVVKRIGKLHPTKKRKSAADTGGVPEIDGRGLDGSVTAVAVVVTSQDEASTQLAEGSLGDQTANSEGTPSLTSLHTRGDTRTRRSRGRVSSQVSFYFDSSS